MVKKDMVKMFLEEVKDIDCQIVRIYGVAMGVGYDMIVFVEMNSNKEFIIDAHATNKSWTSHGHLRDNQVGYNAYKGRNNPERYIFNVKRHWESKNGLREYLLRYSKKDLQKFIDTYGD